MLLFEIGFGGNCYRTHHREYEGHTFGHWKHTRISCWKIELAEAWCSLGHSMFAFIQLPLCPCRAGSVQQCRMGLAWLMHRDGLPGQWREFQPSSQTQNIALGKPRMYHEGSSTWERPSPGGTEGGQETRRDPPICDLLIAYLHLLYLKLLEVHNLLWFI